MDASVINTVNIFISIASIGTYLHLAKEKNLIKFLRGLYNFFAPRLFSNV